MELTVNIPEFISIDLYQKVNAVKAESPFSKLVNTVSAITDKPISEVRTLPVGALTSIANDFADIADPKQDFHTCFEYEGQLYGYAHIKQTSLGEYIDIEELAKDTEANLHKLAAILYRPVTNHRFKSLKFVVKQKIKTLKGLVETPFEYYDVEKYDSQSAKDRAELFRELPVDIVLGGLSFFLAVSSLYLNSTLYSQGHQSQRTTNVTRQNILQALENFGGGSEPYIASASPTYYRSTEKSQ